MGLFVRVGVPMLLVVGGFVYLLHAADSVKPDRHQTRIEIPHALDN